MSTKERENRQVNIQLSEEEDERLDREIDRRRAVVTREHPGLRVSKTEIARTLLLERLGQIEGDE